MSEYLKVCQSSFWKDVFREEFEYLLPHIKGCTEVLSVGCGPAIIERGLSENGFSVTGLDVSKEALDGAPDVIRAVVGKAEKMPFPDSYFDAILFVASLQFMDDYQKALQEANRVLRANSKIILMMLNPESAHFRKWTEDPNSYMNKIKHTNLAEIERAAGEYFSVQSEYFLGIDDEDIFPSADPKSAALFVVRGQKK